MVKHQDDFHDLIEEKRFLAEIEQGIRFANREIIHQRIPSLSTQNILSLAVAVGRLRARYLEAAFKMGINESGDPPDKDVVEDLRLRREMYEEARNAFEALRDAISKGYVDVDKTKKESKE